MTFDAIVVGLGGMGTAAVSHLARRGARVLGLDQYPPGHRLGSSHGHTRIIRTAYYEHPAYVPLVRRAFTLWRELEARTGRSLLTDCPCLTVGPTGGELMRGVLASAGEHALDVEALTSAEVERRYPQFRVPTGMTGVVERAAGFLRVEECVRAHRDDAVATGRAEFRDEEAVIGRRAVGGGVEVRTSRGTYSAANLVLTAGAWAGSLLADLGVPLTVMRQVQLWFDPPDPAAFTADRFPIFLVDLPGGAFYGLPATDGRGVKCARHYGAPELPSPDAVNRTITAADEAPVRAFLETHLPGVAGPLPHAEACLYTLTPDRHFVIGRHPAHPQVAFACGFSGHGFKFAPTVGEVLADLTLTGTTAHPIGMFRPDRFNPKNAKTSSPQSHRGHREDGE